MEYRNITRVFTFNKGLRAYNKGSEYPISNRQLNVLYAIDCLGNCALKDIGAYLKSFSHTLSDNQLIECIRSLVSAGYVCKSVGYSSLYSLSMLGSNVLDGIEARCRETRYDR